MTTREPMLSPEQELEDEAPTAALAITARAIEVVPIVLLGLLVCPPLAILTFLVLGPLLVMTLAVGLLVAIVSAPILLVHHLRGHRGHWALLRHRVHHAGRAIADLAPHRVVADSRRQHAG